MTDNPAGAHERLSAVCEAIIADGDMYIILQTARVHAGAVSAQHPDLAARVLGSVETTRVTEGFGALVGDELSDRTEAVIRAQLSTDECDAARGRGRSESIVDLMREMAALPAC